MVNLLQQSEALRREYPFQPRRFRTANGASMSYLDEGPRSTEAVVMLHGNPTWSFYYRHLVTMLSSTHRCIVPDHIGMGLSEKPQDYPYNLSTRIADVETLLQELGIERVHLIVHDWGGAIGFGLATRRPKLIGRIVVLNTAAFLAPVIPPSIALCRTKFPGTLIVRGLNGFARPATWMAMNQRQLSSDEKYGYLAPYGSWADRVAVNAFVKDIPMHGSHPSYAMLAGIEKKLPLLGGHEIKIVWGGADFCFNRYFYERWTGLFPNACSHFIDDAGHYVLEDARAAVLPLVRDFLAPVERR